MKNDKEGSIKLVTSLAIMVLLVVLVGVLGFKILNYKQEYTNEKCYVCADAKLINHEMKFTSTKLQQKETISSSLDFHKTMEESMREEAMKNHIEAVRIEYEKRHKEELEKERLRRLEEKKKAEVAKKRAQAKAVSRGSGYKGVNQDLGVFNVSWYGSDCKGCHPEAKTASGVPVKNTITYQGYGVAASDWSVIPPFSIIEVEGYGQYIILDKGGAIKGKKLDLLTTSEAKSRQYGRQHLNVKVLRWGKK